LLFLFKDSLEYSIMDVVEFEPVLAITFDYTKRGLYVTFAFGDRDERTFKEAEKYTAPGGGGLVIIIMYTRL